MLIKFCSKKYEKSMLSPFSYPSKLKIKTVALGISLVSGLATLPTLAYEPEYKTPWHEAPSLPYRTQEIYPTVYRDHIIVAGGLSPDVDENKMGVSDRVVIYSLKDKSWREGPKLPERRHHPMLVVVNNQLLSFGGFIVDKHGIWHNSTDVLELIIDNTNTKQDIFSNARWKKIADMPAPLAETLSAVNNGKVHLVSGRTPTNSNRNSQWIEQTDVNSHFIFDPIKLSWEHGANVPTAKNSACSVNTNGNLYTIGGRTVSGGNLASHEAYNFDKQTWQTLAPLPEAQGGLACAAHGDQIYVFGGEYFDNGGGVYNELWQYDIASNTWQSAGKMPNPRHGLGALAIDDKIYVIAGASQAGGNQTSTAMTVFSPKNLK